MPDENINSIKDLHNQGRSRMRGKFAGPGGNCLCPSCGSIVPHTAGDPCNQKTCPKCGKQMIRE